MSDWFSEFNGIFFITISGLICTSVSLLIRYCLKSKCEDVNICYGLINIKRNVNLEVEEEIKQMENGETKNNEN
jgi:hypothetical protein